MYFFYNYKDAMRTSLMALGFGLCNPNAEAWVSYPVRELDPTCCTNSSHAATKDPTCHK